MTKLGLKRTDGKGILQKNLVNLFSWKSILAVSKMWVLCLIIVSLSAQLIGRFALTMNTTPHHTEHNVQIEASLHDLMHLLAEPHSHDESSEDGFSLDNSAESRLHVLADFNFPLQLLPVEQWLVAVSRSENLLFFVLKHWNSLPPDGLRRPPRF